VVLVGAAHLRRRTINAWLDEQIGPGARATE
jgi:hypothetical protein